MEREKVWYLFIKREEGSLNAIFVLLSEPNPSFCGSTTVHYGPLATINLHSESNRKIFMDLVESGGYDHVIVSSKNTPSKNMDSFMGEKLGTLRLRHFIMFDRKNSIGLLSRHIEIFNRTMPMDISEDMDSYRRKPFEKRSFDSNITKIGKLSNPKW